MKSQTEKKFFELTRILSSIKELKVNDLPSAKKDIEIGLHRIAIKGSYLNKPIVFRYLVNGDEKFRNLFINEIKILENFKANSYNFQPQIIKYDLDKTWMIQSYVDGEVSGSFFNFSEGFIVNIKPEQIIEILKRVQKCKVGIGDNTNIAERYLNKLKFINDSWPFDHEKKFSKWLDATKLVINKNLSQKLVLCHGDFNVGNIIYNGNNVYVIDWETAHNDLPFIDFANAYYRASDFPEWQKEYLDNLILNEVQIREFLHYYSLFLVEDICNLHVRGIVKNQKMYREGEISIEKIKRIIERNKKIFYTIN